SNQEQGFFVCVGSAVKLDSYVKESRARALKALRELGWLGWTPPDRPKQIGELFDFITPETIRPLQSEVVKLTPKLTGPCLVLIEAPMGEGKTEAAMYLADYFAAVLHQQGCYFALPTMATSNQMFTRVKEFLQARYPEDQVNFQLLHGHAALSAEFEGL